MADYNIYIHSFGQYDAPTTPFQLREDSDSSGVGGEGGAGGSGFGAVRRAASFLTNPDSAIGQVVAATTKVAGKILPFAIAFSLFGIAKKVMDIYVPYSSGASGDYSFKIKYDNFFQGLHNAFHPVSTEIARQQAELERKKQNLKNEQQRLLFGGTIYDSRYGRNL